MTPYLDAAALQRSLLVYLVGRSAALPLFLFVGYQAIAITQAPWPGALVMANGIVGLIIVLAAYRLVGTGGTPRPDTLLWTLAGIDAVTLIALLVWFTFVVGMAIGLLVFFLVVDLFSGWTMRTGREVTTGRH